MAKDKKTPSIVSQGAVMRRVLQYIGPHVSLVVLSLALCLISVALTLRGSTPFSIEKER